MPRPSSLYLIARGVSMTLLVVLLALRDPRLSPFTPHGWSYRVHFKLVFRGRAATLCCRTACHHMSNQYYQDQKNNSLKNHIDHTIFKVWCAHSACAVWLCCRGYVGDFSAVKPGMASDVREAVLTDGRLDTIFQVCFVYIIIVIENSRSFHAGLANADGEAGLFETSCACMCCSDLVEVWHQSPQTVEVTL